MGARDKHKPSENQKIPDNPTLPLTSVEDDDRGRGNGHRARAVPARKLYQDEIYGTKELSPLAVALIDTPEVQRLGHIYQLGFTYTIFRGANHYRFDHCVGTYFMVRTLMRRIVQNHARLYSDNPEAFAHPGCKLSPRLYIDAPGTGTGAPGFYSPMGRWRGVTEIVSVAGLLHDLGHVPVGHTLEDEFTLLEKHDRLGGPRLFEMLYGPRTPYADNDDKNTQAPAVEKFFTPINEEILPHPETWQRVPLPWVFEDRTYERFFPDIAWDDSGRPAVPVLRNWEIRDLVYLILSFKETVDNTTHTTFKAELEKAEVEAEKLKAANWIARLSFLKQLYDHFSTAVDVGQAYETLPMFYPFMADVVGNTICADLLDYLVRDGKRLKLDIRDNARLQRYLVIRPASSFVQRDRVANGKAESGESLRLTIHAVYRNGLRRRDTVSDLLDLMRERHRFAEVVYYHPKKAAFSAMLVKAMELLPGATPVDGDGIYPAPWAGDMVRAAKRPHVVHLGDKDLLSYLDREAEAHSRADASKKSMALDLLRGIYYRNEYRRLFTLDYEAATNASGPEKFISDLRTADKKNNIPDAGRKRMERILEAVVVRAGLGEWNYDENCPVLIYCPNIRSQAKEVAAHVELVQGRVTPLNRQGDDKPLRDEIELLNTKYRHLWRLYLFIHPRLLAAALFEPHGRDVLSAIIDTFCLDYAVKEDDRRKGCRYEYVPFAHRLDAYFQRWFDTVPQDWPRGEVLARCQDTNMWAEVVGAKDARFPVSADEYAKGFTRAAVVAAADAATVRERAGWPTELKAFQGTLWHKSTAVPRSESARNRANQKFETIAEAVLNGGSPERGSFSNWETFRKYVATSLRDNES